MITEYFHNTERFFYGYAIALSTHSRAKNIFNCLKTLKTPISSADLEVMLGYTSAYNELILQYELSFLFQHTLISKTDDLTIRYLPAEDRVDALKLFLNEFLTVDNPTQFMSRPYNFGGEYVSFRLFQYGLPERLRPYFGMKLFDWRINCRPTPAMMYSMIAHGWII